MKLFSVITAFLLAISAADAQNLIGITGIRDTSYTVANEYKKHIKNFPFITVVPDTVSDKLKEERNITYCKIGNRELKIDVFSSADKGTKKRTAIIFIHGGGWRSGDKAMHHQLMQRLALLDYVCFTPEYRLSTEALYPAAVHDIKSVVSWVRRQVKKYRVDSDRIVVAGHSAGGELAAFMGATNGQKAFERKDCCKKGDAIVNGVIDLDGTLAFIHPESGEGDDTKKISAATYWFGYSKKDNPERWKQASPLTHVGRHTPPFLFINSSVARMYAGRDDFITVLNENRIYSEVKTFEESPHTFCFFRPWFDPMVSYIDGFLKKIFPAK